MQTKRVPELTLGDRLMLTREKADIRSIDMAEMLGVSRHSLTNWEKGRNKPNKATLMKWAELTEFSLDFIQHGRLEDIVPSVDNGSRKKELVAALIDALLDGGNQLNDLGTSLATSAFLNLAPIEDVIDLRDRILMEAVA